MASVYPHGVAMRLMRCVCSRFTRLPAEDSLSFALTIFVGGQISSAAGMSSLLLPTLLLSTCREQACACERLQCMLR